MQYFNKILIETLILDELNQVNKLIKPEYYWRIKFDMENFEVFFSKFYECGTTEIHLTADLSFNMKSVGYVLFYVRFDYFNVSNSNIFFGIDETICKIWTIDSFISGVIMYRTNILKVCIFCKIRNLSTKVKPTSSQVLTSYLKQCNEPPWTSYFVKVI